MNARFSFLLRGCLVAPLLVAPTLSAACGGPDFIASQSLDGGNSDAKDAGREARSPLIICEPCPPDMPPAEAGDDGGDGALEAADGGDATIEGGGASVEDGGLDASDGNSCSVVELVCDGGCLSPKDMHSCGSCANDCALLSHVEPTSLGCSDGLCSYKCARGYADCSDAGTGCETDLSKSTTCGVCGVQCSGGAPLCSPTSAGGFACVSGCPASAPSLCNGSCVDEQTDGKNCNACGAQCAGGMTCQGGACSCPSGTHGCGGTCESSTSIASCGTACSSPCPGPTNGASYGSATCDGTTCGIACNPGYTLCGNACLNLQSDALSCGSCGHDCLGGICSAGMCQPYLVVGPPTVQFGAPILSDGTNIVWYDNNGQSISQVPIRGGAVVTLATGVTYGSGNAPPLSIANGVVAWPAGGGGVWTASEGQANSAVQQPFMSTNTGIGAVALNASGTHIGLGTGGSIYDCTLGASGCTALGTVSSVAYPVANATSFFFADTTNNNIDSFTFGAASFAALILNQTSLSSIALDSTYLYWIANGTIARSFLNGTAIVTIVSGASGTTSLRTDGTKVYVFDTSVGYVRYAPVGGGQLATLAKVNTPFWDMTVAGGAVMWSDTAGIHAVRFP